MKLKHKVCIFVSVFMITGILVLFLIPKRFGNHIDPNEVNHINLFDCDTGVGFTIDDPDQMKLIVENIQNVPMKRTAISMKRKEVGFSVSFIDENDKDIIPLFFMNSEDSIQKRPFLYTFEGEGKLCFDYLKALEKQYLESKEK